MIKKQLKICYSRKIKKIGLIHKIIYSDSVAVIVS